MKVLYIPISIVLVLSGLSSIAAFAQEPSFDVLINDALRGQHRLAENRQRDTFRHPQQTLEFFGLQPDMTVVEIWPGRGWYTELLAPVLRDEGKLYLAGFSLEAKKSPQWRKSIQQDFLQKLAADPKVYDQAIVTALSIPEESEIAPEGSADMILTFRNVHNWMKGGYAEAVFEVFFRTLKSGGILGIVEHRALPDTSLEQMIDSGYVTEQQVVDYAEAAGFIYQARTDINANSNDTTQHPAGVWTLPPTLRYCNAIKDKQEQDRCIEKYRLIGESDRMTLRFLKP